jgi:hypothetical protein
VVKGTSAGAATERSAATYLSKVPARKHRTDSGFIRYDQRRDSEWPQVAREIITAEKPQFAS